MRLSDEGRHGPGADPDQLPVHEVQGVLPGPRREGGGGGEQQRDAHARQHDHEQHEAEIAAAPCPPVPSRAAYWIFSVERPRMAKRRPEDPEPGHHLALGPARSARSDGAAAPCGTRAPVSLNDATWITTDRPSITKTPPRTSSSISFLMTSETTPSAPPSDEAAGVAHQDFRGMRVEPEEADRRAHHGQAEDGDLPAALDEGDAEVLGVVGAARQVGEHRDGEPDHDDEPDGQAVQAVGQVDGVRVPGEQQHGERHVETSPGPARPASGTGGTAGWCARCGAGTAGPRSRPRPTICPPNFTPAARPLCR